MPSYRPIRSKWNRLRRAPVERVLAEVPILFRQRNTIVRIAPAVKLFWQLRVRNVKNS